MATPPSEALVELFTNAFPRHPVSQLGAALVDTLLGAFARSATFLVACDMASAQEIGFVVGGRTSDLDRVRVEFIRTNLSQIVVASLRKRRLLSLALPRVGLPKRRLSLRHSLYQLRFIAVAPQARGQQVGTCLLRTFEETLPVGAGYHLWTLAGNRSETFYLGHGFTRDIAVDGHVRFYRNRTE